MSRTWVDVQKKTFTGWSNNFLKERILKINSIEKDFEDGVMLINLLEIISGKQFIKYVKNPKGRFQKIENNNWALKFIRDEGLKLVGIGAEDIVDGKLKLILGMIWTLILRYQIQSISAEDGESPKSALLEWVRKRVAPYGVQVNDFDRSWQDARALAALTDSLSPGKFPLSSLSGDAVSDANRAMDISQDDYNIPKILDAYDLVNVPDELSTMTYVSYFRDYATQLEKLQEESLKLEEERRKTRADAIKCTAEGPGLEGGFANEPALFTIKAHNFYGEPLAHGGENFTIHVTAEDGQPVEAAVTDKRDGTYNVAYMPSAPQTYQVLVTLDGKPIKNAPFTVKIEGGNALTSTASGPGLIEANVGKPGVFTIQSRDSNGNPVKNGGDPFEVLISLDGGAVHTEISDNGDGTYSVTYNPEYPGEYLIDVSLRGEHLGNMPLKVPGFAATPDNSYAEGPGLEHGQALHPALFTIHAVNSDGEHLKEGGDPFAVSVDGPSGHDAVTPSITDNGDGTYAVSYTPTAPGDYSVTVFLLDKPLKHFPKQVFFKPAANADKTEVSGPGLKDGQAERPCVFKITARDADGNQRKDGGDNFVVSVDGPVQVNPDIKDNGDGTYDVTYQATEPGNYSVNVKLDDAQVAHLPVKVQLRPAPSAANSYAEGEGLTKVFDNEPATFLIHAKDAKGNKLSQGGDPFKVEINGPTQVEPTVHDNGDGTYTVTYAPDTVGDYNVNVTLDGHPIKDAPHHVTVKEGTDAGFSGFGSFTLTVVAKDKKGVPKTFGGDAFEVTIKGPAEQLAIQAFDNEDGTYTAAYALVGTGHYSVDVRLNGKSIEGSPFKQNVGSIKKDKANPAKVHSTTVQGVRRSQAQQQ